ncbi:MAG: ABC transporter permease [Turicibacter sp.]
MRTLKHAKLFFQGFILLNVLWYVGSVFVDSKALPSPIDVYMNLGVLVEKQIHMHILASSYRVGAGLFISLTIGVSLGLLMGYSNRWNKILNPLIYFTYPIPKTALLPVVMVLCGLGDGSKIMLIVLIVVFQVIVSVRDSVQNIPKEMYNPIKSLGASRYQLFRHVTLPAIVPDLLTNLRLSVGTALSILFFAEAYGTREGLGYFIQDSWSRIDYMGMYAGIIILSLLGFVLFMLIDLLESVVCKWKG